MMKFSNLLLFIIILTLCLPAMAQTTTGTISGRVVDSQGAVVGGAAVTVTSATTNVAHAVQTNNDGLYTVPQLLPGTYSVSVVTPNFRKEIRNNLTLQIGQTLDLEFSLSVGATTETVNVTSSAPLVQTQSAAVGSVIDNQKIEEIPLNGRQYYSLSALIPGAMPPVYNSSLSYRGGINLAGAAETSTFYSLDGLNNMDTAITGPAVVPSVEDIQEFKIYTGANFEAEFGHNVGGTVVVTSRSGGNAYHGDVYEFIRNQIFDAKNYFQTSGTKLSYKRNDFGGTFGGHIIPNKMFFFFSGEVLLLHNQYTALSTVPTVAQVGGVFTGEAPLNVPTGYPTDVIDTANNSINFAALVGAQATAETVGAALLSYYPADTTTGASNYNFNAPSQEKSEVYQLRIDNNYNAKNTTYATLNWYNNPYITPGNVTCSVSSIPGFDCNTGLTDQLYGGGWTHIFTPNVINTLVAGYQRSNVPRISLNDNVPFDEMYNIPAFAGPPAPDNNGIPFVTVLGFASYGGATNLPQLRQDNAYDFLENVLWNKGDHSFNFGFEYTRFIDAVTFLSSGRGAFTFNGTYTGNPIADELLGLPTQATRSNNANPVLHYQESYFAGYAEDSWRILPNLTFNYGLRWEETTPFTPGNTQAGGFNLVTGLPFTYNENGVPNHLYHAYTAGWAPRLGLSYRPFKNDNTVLQAGFGVANDAVISTGSLLAEEDSYPERIAQTTIGTVGAPLSLPDPWPSITTVAGESPAGISPNFRGARNVAYTLGVEQKLGSSIVLTLNYQGSETSHIAQTYNVNQSLPQASAALGNGARPYGTYTTISYEFPRAHANYNALYAKLQQNLSHGLTFIISYTYGKAEDDGDEEAGTVQNIHNLPGEKGLSDFDVRNRFVASPVYQLPFGPGRQFLNQGWASKVIGNWEVAAEIALQDGTPVTPTDGANVSNNGETSGDRPYVQGNPNSGPHHIGEWFNVFDYNYQNVISGTPAPGNGTATGTVPQTQANSFPGTTVVPATPMPYGNARHSSIQSPGYEDVDVNIARTFPITHRMSMQFRGELFDALNSPQFEQPNAVFTGFQKNATTGVVSPKGSFGQITAANGARNIEFALKLFF
jgi:hypothetical protein